MESGITTSLNVVVYIVGPVLHPLEVCLTEVYKAVHDSLFWFIFRRIHQRQPTGLVKQNNGDPNYDTCS
jgi:hypothetical protein